MATVQVTHYRDHKNGGKFDGTCYIEDSAALIYNENIDSTWYLGDVKTRLKFPAITEGDTKWVWSFGDTDDERYSLGIKNDSGTYKFIVELLDVTYTIENDYLLPNKHLTIILSFGKVSSNYYIYINIGDKYGNFLPLTTTLSTSTVADFPIGTGLLIGKRDVVDSDNFIGIIYDLQYEDEDYLYNYYFMEMDAPNGSKVKRGRLTKATPYSAASATVDITSKPSDFWDSGTDISNYFSQRLRPSARFDCDNIGTQQFENIEFETFNYSDIAVGDTIEIKIDSVREWIFNVDEVIQSNIIGDEIYKKIKCSSILAELQNMKVYIYNWMFTTDNTGWDRNWWVDSAITITGDYSHTTSAPYSSSWSSLFFLLEKFVATCQYQKLITAIDLTELTGLASPYYDYNNTAYIDYDDLIFNYQMFFYIGRGSSTYDTEVPNMDVIFRELLKICRIRYAIQGTTIKYYPTNFSDDYAVSITDNNTIFSSSGELKYEKFFKSETETIDFITITDPGPPPVVDYYDVTVYDSSFDETDLIEWEEKPSVKTKYPSLEVMTMQIPSHLWLAVNDSGTQARMAEEDNENENFPYQYAAILETELTRTKTLKRIKFPLCSDYDDEFYVKIKSRIDDLSNKTTEILYEE